MQTAKLLSKRLIKINLKFQSKNEKNMGKLNFPYNVFSFFFSKSRQPLQVMIREPLLLDYL
jgi:hypothetical protein